MTRKRTRHKVNEFLVSDRLLYDRKIFLYDDVTQQTAGKIIKELLALDAVSSRNIYLYLNTDGGDVGAALGIIETMRRTKSKIVTIINSCVCSMGTHIAINGNVRWAVPSATFMSHAMTDYLDTNDQTIFDRANYLKKLRTLLENDLRKHTKLTEREIGKARKGELWLFADEMLEKGVIDKII